MGASCYSNENNPTIKINRSQSIIEKLINELEDIPNDQYTCIECILTPELTNINYNNGIIKFKCPKHKDIKRPLKEYFKEEIKNLYYNYECKNDNLKQKDNLSQIFDYCTKCKEYFCESCANKHEHNKLLIKVNKLNDICHTHLKEYS